MIFVLNLCKLAVKHFLETCMKKKDYGGSKGGSIWWYICNNVYVMIDNRNMMMDDNHVMIGYVLVTKSMQCFLCDDRQLHG